VEANDRIIERIRKMLALANDAGATEGERDNALRAAHATLAKYNLDMAEVEQHKTAKQKQAEGEPRTVHNAQFFGRPWARAAIMAVAKLCFCSYVYGAATNAKLTKHYFVGRYSNSVTASLLSEYVVNSINREGRTRQRREGRLNPWFISFAWGAAVAITQRVEQLLRDGSQELNRGAGTDLVLASLYDTEARDNALVVQERWPKLRTGLKGKGIHDLDGYSNGQAFGTTINLDRSLS